MYIFSLLLYLGMLGLKMIMYAFMIELYQPDYWYSRKNIKNVCITWMESLVVL